MVNNDKKLQDAVASLERGLVEDALRHWRDSQEALGICKTYLCANADYYATCCAHHFQGRLLTLSLMQKDGDFYRLSTKLGHWIENQAAAQNDTAEHGIVRIVLPEGLIIGHPAIDHDHKTMVKIINDISVAHGKQDYAKCGRLFENFVRFSENHFTEEEKILIDSGFENTQDHINHHQNLLNRENELRILSHKLVHDDIARARFLPELVSFLFDDILKADLDFKNFLIERGIVG